MLDFSWKIVYYDGTGYSDRDGPMEKSPDRGALFVVQPGRDPEVCGINAAWIMYRRDLDKWTQCGEDGFQDHASLFGHLIGCWRHTIWSGEDHPTFKEAWAMAREESGR